MELERLSAENLPLTFCMAPWSHLHLFPQGTAFACCMSVVGESLGNANQQSLGEIWNSDKMKALRVALLKGEQHPNCVRCKEHEAAGARSARVEFNQRWIHHLPIVKTTTADGHVEKLNLPNIDFRFSNACNMKCRTCNPDLSSRWHEDGDAVYGPSDRPKLERLNQFEKIWTELEPSLSSLEEIYFAGGEPLLMEEHYKILDMLIERKLFHVRLRYSTNFSKLKYKHWDILEMWSKFHSVHAIASLDGKEERASYIRHGTHWSEIEKNRILLKEKAPHVRFSISLTVSILNVLHVTEFHKDWVERGLVDVHEFYLNLLNHPTYYHIQNLTVNLKKQVREKYEAYIHSDLKKFHGCHNDDCRFIRKLHSVLRFMEQESSRQDQTEFIRVTRLLDTRRNESFETVFPELSEMLNSQQTDSHFLDNEQKFAVHVQCGG